ncbi:hypothetical protein EJB05_18081, partial [Eragrostis curvula]
QTFREESSSKSKVFFQFSQSWKKRADIQGRSHHEVLGKRIVPNDYLNLTVIKPQNCNIFVPIMCLYEKNETMAMISNSMTDRMERLDGRMFATCGSYHSSFLDVKSLLSLRTLQGRAHHISFQFCSQLIIHNWTMDRRRKKPLGDQGDFAGDAVDPVLLKKRADSAERSRRYRARQKDGRSNSPLSTVNACEPAGCNDENQHPNKRISVLERSTIAARKRCSPLTTGLSPLSDVTNLVTPTVVASCQNELRKSRVTSSTYRKVHCTPLSYVPVDVTASGISAEQRISDVKNDSDAREEMRKAKNRIRQQEYRKRKREEREKAEEGYNIQTPTLPTVENEQDQPPKKRKYVRKNKTMPGELRILDPTPCSAVTEQQQTPASVNRFSVDVTPVSALTGEHGQTGTKFNQKGGHVVVDGWLHINDDYLPSYSAVMRNNDGKGDQGVTPDQTQGGNRLVYMREYMSKRRKKQKEEEPARVASEKTGVARDDDVGHHGNWEPDENDNIHFGEEDLDAADPGVQYDLPIEDQDEEARLYGLRGMYIR